MNLENLKLSSITLSLTFPTLSPPGNVDFNDLMMAFDNCLQHQIQLHCLPDIASKGWGGSEIYCFALLPISFVRLLISMYFALNITSHSNTFNCSSLS